MAMNISGIVRELESTGMRVEIGGDFSRYRALRLAQADRPPMYPMFDTASSYVDESNGFWVCGFNQDGDLVHTQAARLLDLGDVSLARHMNVHRHKYITPGTTPDPDQTYYSGPDALTRITGRVCYHGDFWLPSSGLGGPRSQGATALLSRILFEVIHHSWHPDFVFALVPKQLAAKGAHLRYGYSHCEPGQWLGPDQQVTEEDFLVWMSARDMANSLSRSVRANLSKTPVSTIRSNLTSIESRG
ncbi:MAG: hypothetical protein AAFQ79_05125 [Pseudomonadota bacterium]